MSYVARHSDLHRISFDVVKSRNENPGCVSMYLGDAREKVGMNPTPPAQIIPLLPFHATAQFS